MHFFFGWTKWKSGNCEYESTIEKFGFRSWQRGEARRDYLEKKKKKKKEETSRFSTGGGRRESRRPIVNSSNRWRRWNGALLSRFTFICKFNRSLPELMIIWDCSVALDNRVKCCERWIQGSPIAEIIGNLSAAPDSLVHSRLVNKSGTRGDRLVTTRWKIVPSIGLVSLSPPFFFFLPRENNYYPLKILPRVLLTIRAFIPGSPIIIYTVIIICRYEMSLP